MRNISRGILRRIKHMVLGRADEHGASRYVDESESVDEAVAEDLEEQPIEALGLNARAINCLRAANVKRVRDLVQHGEGDLLRVPNLGAGTLEHIRSILRRRGFELGGETYGDGRLQHPGRMSVDLDASVNVLRLNVRASNCLRRLGVTRVEDLVMLREADLLMVPNLGRGTVEHIASVLREYGLELGAMGGHGGPVEGHDEAAVGASGSSEEAPKQAANWVEVIRELPIPGRTWIVLDGRFGVGRRLTLRALADRIGVTRERVRQIEKAGVDVLSARATELAPRLKEVEEAIAERVTGTIEADVDHLVSEIRDASNDSPADGDVRRLLLVLRALAGDGSAEARWPILSFCACMLTPAIGKHGEVRKQIEEAAAASRERTRQWTYRELSLHVLREEQGPLHWREIAERCEMLGKRRDFSASSCFNQMQMDRDLFVRVGQGTYALTEWGVDRSETLNELIATLLFESGDCLSYGEILHRSSARQEVKALSIQMTLDLHPRFYRSLSGKYGLRAWLPARDRQTLRTPRDLVEAEDSERRVSNAEARGYNVTRMVVDDRKRLQ